MEATERQSVTSVEYEARRAAIVRRLRSEAASPAAVVRETARIIRWLSLPQPEEAIGPVHGIVSDDAFQLQVDAYQLVVLVHTGTGKPSIQIETVGRSPMDDIPEADRRLFFRVVERISRDHVVADWDSMRRYCVAIDVPVHPTLVRAVTSNRTRFSRCEDPSHHTAAFVVPSGWHR